eukprot:6463992-Amphidinium_carterae.2
MHRVEAQNTEFPLSGLDATDASVSRQLYYVLLLLTRQQPMTLIINAGEQEGLLAWRRLLEHYEPHQRTRFAGQLLSLLSWDFGDINDVENRIESFEREALRYESQSTEKLTDTMRIGIALRQLPDSALRQHLLLNATRLTTWSLFKQEVVNIRCAQANLGPVPMQLDALRKGGDGKGGPKGNKGGEAKGGGGAKLCHYCGKPGHFQADWRLRKQQQQQTPQQQQKPKGGGRGQPGGKGQADRSKVQCRKCKGFGHIAKDCPTRSLNDSIRWRSRALEEPAGAAEPAGAVERRRTNWGRCT